MRPIPTISHANAKAKQFLTNRDTNIERIMPINGQAIRNKKNKKCINYL